MYTAMCRLLELERVIWHVEPFVPLPALGARFDLATSFMVCFNDHSGVKPWDVEEWRFFLDDVARHLNPSGRLWLELNPQADGVYMSRDVEALFLGRGARIEGYRVILDAKA